MRKLGFTLAEVLITLVIIGVIAAMTVPSLMQNTNAQEYRSGLKKAISGLNQALQLEYALEGLIPGDAGVSTHAEIVANIFNKRMNVMSGTGNDATNWANVTRTGKAACSGTTFTTQDGFKFCFESFTAQPETDNGLCNMYNTIACFTGSTSTAAAGANFWIDVNGDRKPNLITTNANRPRDIYQATLYAQKVVPYGGATQGVMYDRKDNNAI